MNRLLAHIRACQNAQLPGDRLAFQIGAALVGYVKQDLARQLAGSARAGLNADGVTLDPREAPRLNEIAAALSLGDSLRSRGELFDVCGPASGTEPGAPLAVLDRGFLPAFGIIGTGVHMNGMVQRSDGLHLWIAIRSATKKLDPGKADNIVAGGVPAGYAPDAAMLKEAAEEAAMPEALARTMRQVATIRYSMERPEGLRRDVLVCYDIDIPENFTPRAADGEVERFELWPVAKVIETLRETNDFKFNVTLVLIDFLIRHELLPEAEVRLLRAALEEGKI
jgi:8-oxo-dGTP pyrophosphatase MutT (NUDIX family)